VGKQKEKGNVRPTVSALHRPHSCPLQPKPVRTSGAPGSQLAALAGPLVSSAWLVGTSKRVGKKRYSNGILSLVACAGAVQRHEGLLGREPRQRPGLGQLARQLVRLLLDE